MSGTTQACCDELTELGDQWVKVARSGEAPYYWHRASGRTQWAQPLHTCSEAAGSDEPDTDQQYFAAYGNWFQIQREMLSDKPRMQGYVDAIEAHADFIRGKVVIDVGAGTGVLSLFCALRAGGEKHHCTSGSALSFRSWNLC
jgi:hypothetical protein